MVKKMLIERWSAIESKTISTIIKMCEKEGISMLYNPEVNVEDIVAEYVQERPENALDMIKLYGDYMSSVTGKATLLYDINE